MKYSDLTSTVYPGTDSAIGSLAVAHDALNVLLGVAVALLMIGPMLA